MRLWSIHPCYLDAKGLVALWREGLLAQKVLQGDTKGYRNHPQLNRFKEVVDSIGAISSYLVHVANEADRRNYNFNRAKIASYKMSGKIPVTEGQIEYEFKHLLRKLKLRNPDSYAEFRTINKIEIHPLFNKISGDVEEWEVIQ
jgi:hypothetical protein